MAEWQPIETAPKGGEIILAHWGETPVFATYVEDHPVMDYATEGWLFKGKTWRQVGTESGWIVVMWGPDIGWARNAGCRTFKPKFWLPLPAYPKTEIHEAGGGGGIGSTFSASGGGQTIPPQGGD